MKLSANKLPYDWSHRIKCNCSHPIGSGWKAPQCTPNKRTASVHGTNGNKSLFAYEELHAEMLFAIDEVCDALPTDFPAALRGSITGGIEQRLQIMTKAAA